MAWAYEGVYSLRHALTKACAHQDVRSPRRVLLRKHFCWQLWGGGGIYKYVTKL
jgi:hypothetical protein